MVLTCGTGDAAAVLSIHGKMRWAEANKATASFTGQPAGTYGIWATTTSLDSDPSFTMAYSLTPPGGTYQRQLGSVVWSGSALSSLIQIVGYERHSFMHSTADPLPDASVSLAMLASDAVGAFAPPGSIAGFGGAAAPSGWLLCDGTVVVRATYAALFAVIGTAYNTGGEAGTDFRLPDLRGRATVGKGTHADVDALGDSDGNAVASRTPNHSHTMPAHGHGKGTLATVSGGYHAHTQDSVGNHQHTIQYAFVIMVGGGGNIVYEGMGASNNWNNPSDFLAGIGNHNHNIQGASHSHPSGELSGQVGTGSAGDSAISANAQSASQRVGYLTSNKIIKT